MVESLSKLGILARINELTISQNISFEIFVTKRDALKAKEFIDKMEIDDSPVDPASDGYIMEYQEWTDKMYDPGNYTGGKTPHFLLDKSNWKFLAPYFLFGGLLLVYLMIKNGFESFDFETFLFSGLYIIAGISMIWQIKKKKK
ncbi:MAG: hypothetical protein ACOYLE_03735 [Bacteroidales bacterium]